MVYEVVKSKLEKAGKIGTIDTYMDTKDRP